jgi:hypothetical protein
VGQDGIRMASCAPVAYRRSGGSREISNLDRVSTERISVVAPNLLAAEFSSIRVRSYESIAFMSRTRHPPVR